MFNFLSCKKLSKIIEKISYDNLKYSFQHSMEPVSIPMTRNWNNTGSKPIVICLDQESKVPHNHVFLYLQRIFTQRSSKNI